MKYVFLLVVAGVGLFVPYIGLALLPLMLTIMILSFLKGRKFCGKVCPHGFLFDNLLVKLSRKTKTPKIFKSIVLITLYFIYFMGTFGFNVLSSAKSDNFFLTLSYALSNMYFIVTIVSVTIGVIFTPRAFCHFCPQGTLQTGIQKLAKKANLSKIELVSLVDINQCINCKACNKICPMEIEVIDEIKTTSTLTLNNIKCIKCEKCVNVCPKNILKLK